MSMFDLLLSSQRLQLEGASFFTFRNCGKAVYQKVLEETTLLL